MARDIETLTLQMSADLRRFEREMAKVNTVTQKRLAEAEARALAGQKNLSRIMERAGSGMVASFRSGIGALAPTLAAAFSAQQVIQYADAYTGLQNRLKATGLEGAALKRVEDSLYETASRNGVAVAATAELYQRASMARDNLGASEQDLLNIVSGTSAALKLQGTSATEASGALLQLGQLLGGSTVQAAEFNSLVDGLPTVLQAVANGSDRWAGSTIKLTKDVKDGKVTVREWSAAMLKGFGDIETRADKSTTTVSAALTTLNDALGRYVGQTDSGLSATQRMAEGIEALANNLDKIVPVLTTIIGFVGVRYAGAMAVSTAATVANSYARTANVAVMGQQTLAAGALSAAIGGNTAGVAAYTLALKGATLASRGAAMGLAMMGGPLGLALTAVSALTVGLVILAQRNSDAAISVRALQHAEQRAQPAKTQLEKLTRELATASRDRAAAIREEIAALINLERVELARLKAVADAEKLKANTETQTARYGSGMGVEAGLAARDQAALQKELELRPWANGESQRETDAVRRATAAYDAQKTVVEDMEAVFKEAKEQKKLLDDTEDKKGKKTDEANKAKQRARLLEDLKAQTELTVAQLNEEVALVRELERQAEITARIRSLEDAGLSAQQAATISAGIQAKLDEARLKAMDREENYLVRNLDLEVARLDETWSTVRAIEEEVELRELVAAFAKVSHDQAAAEAKAQSTLVMLQSARADAAKRGLEAAREEHRLTIAQLSGNRALAKQLEDQAEIRDRARRYQEDGRLTREEAVVRASSEVGRERQAATYGEQRDMFANAFSDGIRAAMSGDLTNFLSNQFGNFADTMFRKAGEQLFDMAFGGIDAVTEGTTQGAAMATTVGPAIVTAGSAAAASMATAIATAGAAAGAAMAAQITAASSAKSILPGFSTGGYTGPGGVHEPKGVVHGGEVVWSQKDVARAGGVAVVEALRKGVKGYATGGVVVPSVNRTVLPNLNHAMSRMQSGQVARAQPVVVQLAVDEGGLFVPRVQAISGNVAIQTTTMGVATVQDQQRASSMRRRQSLVG